MSRQEGGGRGKGQVPFSQGCCREPEVRGSSRVRGPPRREKWPAWTFTATNWAGLPDGSGSRPFFVPASSPPPPAATLNRESPPPLEEARHAQTRQRFRQRPPP